MPLLLSAIIAIVALICQRASADEVTISPSSDTCLFERDPDNNWGAEPEVVAGVLGDAGDNARCRILLAFDIAGAVPAGSTITSAELTMVTTRTPPGAPNTTFQLLRVLVPWVEGIQAGSSIPGGDSAASGETTWAHRIHPATDWATPGGGAEVDFAEDPSSTGAVSGNPSGQAAATPTSNNFSFNAEGIADLNSMLAAPANNFGWAFFPLDESTHLTARRWASTEHPSGAPQLKITFTPPLPPPVPLILDAQIGSNSGDLFVTFTTQAGELYNLETRTELDSGDWVVALSDIAGTGGGVTVSTTPPADAERLFFRVSRQ